MRRTERYAATAGGGVEKGAKMTENDAIKCQQAFKKTYNGFPKEADIACNMAIKALEEVQQYRAIGTVEELQDMKDSFFEALSDWRKYRKIGTPEECRAAMEKQTAVSRELIEGKYFCPKCHNLMRYPGYCGCGQRLY